MDNEQNIPIDIHTNKLLDWLISRRHCKRDWQQTALLVREKINNAIQDMPANDEIMQLLIGSYINYFHCKQIVELLKGTEASTKNIFGQYSSQRMKDWQEIIRLYEKDNVCLAEAAQMLIRNVNYEVPSLKRQITKCQQLQEELSKKEIDYSKNANEIKEKYYATCKQIGIEGNNVRKELILLLNELPTVFSDISNKIKKELKPAQNFYLAFLLFTLKRDNVSSECLPLLNFIIEKGNTTTYEWKTGEAPEIVEETKSGITVQGMNQNDLDDQIDFGDAGSGIDFGDDSSSTPNGDYVHVEKIDFGEGDTEQICFEEDTSNDSRWEMMSDSSNVISEPPVQDENSKVARGEDALTLLDNQSTRNMFLNELFELEAFLQQRLSEMSSTEDILSANQFQAAPPTVQLQAAKDVEEMMLVVKNIIAEMSTVKMQHLYLIKNSPKYVDRLSESLGQKLELVSKMIEAQKTAVLKREQALNEEKSLEPKLALIILKTKELQNQIEKEISKHYKNRPVNIMGGVNVM